MCFTGKLVAIYPLDERNGERDIGRKKNKPARLNKVRVGRVKGPDGRPKGATRIPGRRNNYIELPNRGKLDTKKSITIAIWVRNLGRAGPIMHYGRKGFTSVHLWFVGPRRMVGRIVNRSVTKRITLVSRKPVYYRAWNFVALTYDNPSGIAKLWINGKPVTKKRVGRVRLATKAPVRIGSIHRNRNVLKADVACAQIYSVALRPKQMREAMRRCFKRSKLLKQQRKEEIHARPLNWY